MDQNFDQRAYVMRGAERVAGEVMRAAWKNPRESAFLLRYGAAFKTAARRRRDIRAQGGETTGRLTICFGRDSGARACTGREWEAFFDAAGRRGVSVILITGDEPLRRRELLEAAGKKTDILFPVFTVADAGEQNIKLFDRCRNLVPAINISEEQGRAFDMMDALQRKNVLFGAYAPATEENLHELCVDARIGAIARRGCKGIVYLDRLSGEAGKAALAGEVGRLRNEYPEIILCTLERDKESLGGPVINDTREELEAFLRQ